MGPGQLGHRGLLRDADDPGDGGAVELPDEEETAEQGRHEDGQAELDRRPAGGGVVDDTNTSTAALSRTQVVPVGAPAAVGS
ncbi:MAG: hypothetical protein ACTHJ6_17520, partial [Oryzihumus sp.]